MTDVMTLVLCLAVSGCALTSKSTPLDIRYFSPETAQVTSTSRPPAARGASAPRVRMGRVTAGAHLGYRIVHRTSPVELGIYDGLRWTERPEEYVRRAVSRELFESRTVTEAFDGTAPELELEVLAFEEIPRDARRAGRVRIRYRIEGGDDLLASGVISVERVARGPAIEDVVAAIGSALTGAATQLADEVARAVTEPPRAPEDSRTTAL